MILRQKQKLDKEALSLCFANKNKKERHERSKVKNTIRFWLKNTTLVYNYCQCWQRFKSQIIKNKSDMAGITFVLTFGQRKGEVSTAAASH